MRKLAFALLACGACKCPGPSAPDAAVAPLERSTDLRTALQLIFPEYRGCQVLDTTATYTRRIEGAGPKTLEDAKALAATNGFTGEPLTREPFTLALEQKGSAAVMTLSLPITAQEIGRIYAAPAAMSTQSMANWLPKPVPANAQDTFDLVMMWQAVKPSRAAFLNWQLVDGLLRGGWHAENLPAGYSTDAGSSTVPDPFKVSLIEPSSQGRIVLEREGEHCRIHYTLVTR